MSETVSPPSGFTLAPSPASDTRDQPTPPSGFTLASDKSVADNEPHQRSYVADVGHSLGSGLVKGTGYVLGMPSDLWQMLDRGYQHLLTRGAVGMGLLTPEEGEQLRQPIPGAEDYQAGSQKINEHLMDLAKKTGADTSGPQTVPGEYAETVGSFLPGAATVGAGSMREVPKALARYGVAPALTSETAGQATKGTPLEPYARVAGAILPEVAMQGVGAAGRAMSPMKDTLAGVSDSDMAAAQDLLERSRTAGAPLTLPEAVQHVTGSATRLGDIQRVVEQSPKGAAIMRPFMAQRPGQTEALGQSTFDQIAPSGADPYQTAPAVQSAAQRVLTSSPEAAELEGSTSALGPQTTAEQVGNVIRPELQRTYEGREGMRNALAGEDYGAARAADYGPDGAAANPVQIRPVIDHIDDALTSAKGGVARALRQARSTLLTGGQPDMTVTGLSNARNAISDQISSAARVGNNQVARALTDVQGQLDYALEQVPAYGQARRNFAAASEPLAPFAEDTTPGRILDRDQFNRSYTMPTERVAPTIERGGPHAADQFLAAAENSPDARAAFGRYYSQQMLGSATNARGVIDPAILANNIRDSADMLRRFPEIAANLNRVGAARTALQQLEQTPIGALAQTTGRTGQEQFAAQRALIFNPTTPLAGSERVIGNTVRSIANSGPGGVDAATQFVRQHLDQAFNEATQNNLPGANQFGGPKFAAVVSGNSQQAKNLEAAVRALPDGDTRWRALRNGLDIMQGMGTRQPVGSQTAFNAQINKWMEQGHPAAEFLTDAASPAQWPGLVKRVYQHVMYDRNTGALAKAFTEGNIADLREIAKQGRNSFGGQAALIGALARQGAETGQQQSPAQP